MPETGFVDRSLSHGGVNRRYQVYIPSWHSPARRWPVILFLHGAGESGRDGLLPTEVGIGRAIRHHARRFPALVVFPQALPREGWYDEAAEFAVRVLEAAVAEFNGDPDRLCLTGLSMGGGGTLCIAAGYPGRFAALAPVCPALSEGSEFDRVLARALRGTPIWIFQGRLDTDPTAARVRRLVHALASESGRVRYTEYPTLGHGIWDRAYAEPGLVPWMLAQRRQADPYGRAATARSSTV